MHGEGATLKRNAYNETYSGNSLNAHICLTAALITNGSRRWRIGLTFIKRLELQIMCPTDVNSRDSLIRHLPSP